MRAFDEAVAEADKVPFPESEDGLKMCTRCECFKPAVCFHIDRQKRDGLASSCKACRGGAGNAQARKRYAENREKAQKRQREYRAQNRERVKEWQKTWADKDREHLNEKAKAAYREKKKKAQDEMLAQFFASGGKR